MSKTVDRRELYDQIWTEPVRTVAARLGVSDTAVKKACMKAAIPTPDRGYWAKLEAGKPVVKVPLPLKPPGLSTEVSFGGSGFYRNWSREELLGEIPPPPQFDEPIGIVRTRIAAALGSVKCAKAGIWHHTLRRLLDQDEKRARDVATLAYAWDKPIFTSPTEKRRLQILNAVFLAVGKFGGKVTVRGKEARDVTISFDRQHVHISLDLPKAERRSHEETVDRLTFAILRAWGSDDTRASWADGEDTRLEKRLTEIVLDVVLTAEIQLRESAVHLHEWRIERKAALEEDIRKHKLEQERRDSERAQRLNEARIENLLQAASDHRKAQEIRAYVESWASRLDPSKPGQADEYGAWADWALRQADRIDPTFGAPFAIPTDDELSGV